MTATTLLALYAALLSTYEAFLKDRWSHRPRVRVSLYESDGVGSGGDQRFLSVNVLNQGYQPIAMTEVVSLEFDETRKRWPVLLFNRMFGHKEGPFAIVEPLRFLRPFQRMVAPGDGYQAFFAREFASHTAADLGLKGKAHVRAIVADGVNRRYKSNWLAIEAHSAAGDASEAAHERGKAR